MKNKFVFFIFSFAASAGERDLSFGYPLSHPFQRLLLYDTYHPVRLHVHRVHGLTYRALWRGCTVYASTRYGLRLRAHAPGLYTLHTTQSTYSRSITLHARLFTARLRLRLAGVCCDLKSTLVDGAPPRTGMVRVRAPRAASGVSLARERAPSGPTSISSRRSPATWVAEARVWGPWPRPR